MDISIRPARPDDAEAVATAHVEAWRVAYRGLVPDAYLDSDAFAAARLAGWRRILAALEDEASAVVDRIFVPVVADRVVGFGHIGAEVSSGALPGRGELRGFYLHPDVWGSGAADALIDRCHTALAASFSTSVLWVLRDNPRARRFYERNGWSCGTGADLVEETWAGPEMDGIAPLAEPLPEVEYRRRFAAS